MMQAGVACSIVVCIFFGVLSLLAGALELFVVFLLMGLFVLAVWMMLILSPSGGEKDE